MSEQPTTTCPTCGAPVQPTGLTIEDVRRWAERMVIEYAESADESWSHYQQAETPAGAALNMDDFNYHSNRRDAYRELAEALSRGELPK